MATTQFHEVHSYEMEISVTDLLCTVGQLIYSWNKPGCFFNYNL